MAHGFARKKLAFARKMMTLPESGGGGVEPPSPLARTPLSIASAEKYNAQLECTKPVNSAISVAVHAQTPSCRLVNFSLLCSAAELSAYRQSSTTFFSTFQIKNKKA